MASITASVKPGDYIGTTDIPDPRGHIAGLTIDGVTIYLGRFIPDNDGEIVEVADLLIDKLVGLRDAAAGRIADAERAALDAESPAQEHQVVAEWTRVTA